MARLETEAKTENLDKINDFTADILIGKPMKLLMQIDLAVEEIFVNIANYAYEDKIGKVWVECTLENDILTIIFEDEGKPFDPLKKDDPDVTASAEEREIGGLGIFLTKKLMDDVNYEYKNGRNVLTLVKKI